MRLRMMRPFAVALFASVACFSAAPSFAQQAQSEDDIVVVGERLQEMVRTFVGEVAAAPSAERQMARWDHHICPLVAGLPARQMQYVADRIARRAHQVDIETDGPGCRANILIFVTPDAGRLATGIVDEYRTLVGYYSTSGLSTLGRGPLDDFTNSSAPVGLLRQIGTTPQAIASITAIGSPSESDSSTSAWLRNSSAWICSLSTLPARRTGRPAPSVARRLCTMRREGPSP